MYFLLQIWDDSSSGDTRVLLILLFVSSGVVEIQTEILHHGLVSKQTKHMGFSLNSVKR